jgi:O-antigen ligase
VEGLARSRPTADFGAGNGIVTVTAGSAALLGAVAVYSPKYAIFALLAAGFVALAMSRLPLAVAAFIVLTFPEHLPGSFGAGATLAKPVGALLVLAWGGAVLTRRAAIPLLPRVQPLLFSALVGLLVFGSVSTLWAVAPSQTHSALGRLALNAALLLVIYTAASSRSGFQTIVYGYLAGSVVASLYTIGSGGYNATSGRLAGVVDTDYFAAELIPAILIACFMFTTTSSRRTRWLAVAVAGADLAAFALTQSRGGIVGLAVGLVAAVVVAGRARARIVALVLVLVAGSLAYYFGYRPSHVFDSGKGGGLNGVSSGRLDLWRVAFRIFEGHPLGGVGLGNYQAVEPAYATQTLNLTIVRQIVTEHLVVHDTYLQMAAELGLVGLSILVAIIWLPLRLAGQALASLARELDDLEFHVRGLVAGAIGMLTAYVFLSAEFEKPLWLVLGLLASVPMLLRDHAAEEDPAAR